jgi:methylthioribose-1-phosphate isomerase
VASVAGTYPLALTAARHGVPVYVCALAATIDAKAATGHSLPIVMRGRHDLLDLPEPSLEGIDARVPSSDVTPADLITGYVTEGGLLRTPFDPAVGSMSAAEPA